MNLYHYTDSARLPWILEAGELQPGRNKIGGFPNPDFIWATTSPHGDRTASGASAGYRSGDVFLVRLALSTEDFFPWAEVAERYPQWTSVHRKRLELAAGGKSDPSNWWCREQPLRLEAIKDIQFRTYSNNIWRAAPRELHEANDGDQRWLGVEHSGMLFMSRQVVGNQGQFGYQIGKLKA